MPPKEIIIAKNAKPYIHKSRFIPEIPLIANAPRYRIEVKLTITYNNNQKTAIIIAISPLYL